MCVEQGVTLENIEKLYSMPWKERVRPFYYLKCLCLWHSVKEAVTNTLHHVDHRENRDDEDVLVHMVQHRELENGGELDEDEEGGNGGGCDVEEEQELLDTAV